MPEPTAGQPEPANPTGHAPVLADEVIERLHPRPGDVAVDGTLGRGGHAALMLPRLGPGGRYVGFDLDPHNLSFARTRLEPLAAQHGVTLDLRHGNFADAASVLAGARCDVLLADLGFASNQVDDPARGLSFREDGPLDMRLDPTDAGRPSAADLVNTLRTDELADLIYQFGEERLSRRIARKIADARARGPIHSTAELARVVRAAYPPPRHGRHRIDPATRTFQALRIAVNGELDALDRLLAGLPDLVSPGGRAGIISFHSLEDRRVKQRFQALEQQDLGRRLTRKPVTASEDEIAANPRARSAKLRVFAFAGQPHA